MMRTIVMGTTSMMTNDSYNDDDYCDIITNEKLVLSSLSYSCQSLHVVLTWYTAICCDGSSYIPLVLPPKIFCDRSSLSSNKYALFFLKNRWIKLKLRRHQPNFLLETGAAAVFSESTHFPQFIISWLFKLSSFCSRWYMWVELYFLFWKLRLK